MSRRLPRSGSLLAVAGMLGASSVLVLIPGTAQAATGYAKLEPVTTTMLPQTQFSVTGRLGNKTPRVVTLKVKQGGQERTIARTRSRADGTYTFDGLRLAASGQLRAITAKQTVTVPSGPTAQARYPRRLKELKAARKRLAKVKVLHAQGKKHGGHLRTAKFKVRLGKRLLAKAQAGLTRRVTVVRAESQPVPVKVVARQSARVAALPPVVQPGLGAAAPANDNVVSAGFVPVREGRQTALQRLENGAWTTVETGVQDASGHGVFRVGDQGTYRVVTTATEEAAEHASAQVTTRRWNVDFEDTFDGTSLGSDWSVQVRGRGGLRSCARIGTDAKLYSVSDGVLRMGVGKDPKMSTKKCAFTDEDGKKHALPYMVNTQLGTMGKYDFTHGFTAARMKVQSAVGMHSAFWMNPNQTAVKGRPDLGTEIDVMEYFGDRPEGNGIAAFVHTRNSNGVVTKEGDEFNSTMAMKGPGAFSQRYHVFSLEWTPKEYVFRVDGREFHRTSRSISQAPQHLILSNLTSSYELVDLKNVKDTAKVDWVRVWK